MERIVKQLTQVYYYVYTATILTTITGYMITMNNYNPVAMTSPLGIALKSILIFYMLISIPLALGGFHYMSKKWISIEDEKLKFEAYKKGAIVRLLLIGIGLIGSIIVFFILKTDVSIIYCAGILAIILLFFCKPTQSKMISELKLEEKEEE